MANLDRDISAVICGDDGWLQWCSCASFCPASSRSCTACSGDTPSRWTG